MSKFFDEGVRIETLIHIEGALIDDCAFPDAFDDFCDSMPEMADAPLYAQLPLLAKYVDVEDYPAPSDVAETLMYGRVRGFLVKAATPVKTFHAQGGGYTYSWGHYRTEWLYAPTAAAIERVCVAWVRKEDAYQRLEAAA